MKMLVAGQWNIIRVIRLVVGVAAVVQGLQSSEVLMVVAGLFVGAMALLNKGCCGTSGCRLPAGQQKDKTKEVSYEEVVR